MQEGPIDEDEFRVPDFCPEKPDTNLAARLRAKRMGGLARMRALLPNAHYGAPCMPYGRPLLLSRSPEGMGRVICLY